MTATKIRKGDWIVFANGIGAYTYSQVLRTPRAMRVASSCTLVDTIDGTIFRRLVREVAPSRRRALEICNELNMEGAMT